MVVGNVIFQTVDVVLVHAAAEIFYFIQQKLACGIVQNIIQRIVCHGAERQQGSLVEVAHHILVVSPRSHFFDTLHGFIGVAEVFGEQIGANQYVCVGFFAVDDASAFAGEHCASLVSPFAKSELMSFTDFIGVASTLSARLR